MKYETAKSLRIVTGLKGYSGLDDASYDLWTASGVGRVPDGGLDWQFNVQGNLNDIGVVAVVVDRATQKIDQVRISTPDMNDLEFVTGPDEQVVLGTFHSVNIHLFKQQKMVLMEVDDSTLGIGWIEPDGTLNLTYNKVIFSSGQQIGRAKQIVGQSKVEIDIFPDTTCFVDGTLKVTAYVDQIGETVSAGASLGLPRGEDVLQTPSEIAGVLQDLDTDVFIYGGTNADAHCHDFDGPMTQIDLSNSNLSFDDVFKRSKDIGWGVEIDLSDLAPTIGMDRVIVKNLKGVQLAAHHFKF